MEIRQFKYFVRIADLGSLSKASKALHIAQPALSQQIAQLEEELGQALFVRSHTGVTLTEPGKVFYLHAQRMIKHLADIRSAVNESSANPCGSVCVGLPLSTASHYAFPVFEAVRSRYPGIEIEFFDMISGNIPRGLESGRLDIGVVVNDDDAASLNATPLMDETLFLTSRPDMAPAHAPASIEQIVNLPLALPGLGQGVRTWVEQAAHSQGLDLPTPVIVANSINIMKGAMFKGIAHGIMPWGAIDEELAAGTLVTMEISPALQRRVYVCTAKDSTLSLAGQAVFATLLEITRARVRAGEWKGVKLL